MSHIFLLIAIVSIFFPRWRFLGIFIPILILNLQHYWTKFNSLSHVGFKIYLNKTRQIHNLKRLVELPRSSRSFREEALRYDQAVGYRIVLLTYWRTEHRSWYDKIKENVRPLLQYSYVLEVIYDDELPGMPVLSSPSIVSVEQALMILQKFLPWKIMQYRRVDLDAQDEEIHGINYQLVEAEVFADYIAGGREAAHASHAVREFLSSYEVWLKDK